MGYIQTTNLQIAGNKPTNRCYIDGLQLARSRKMTVASAKPGMLCVDDTGTYKSGAKPLANATANYQNRWLIDGKTLPDSSDQYIGDVTNMTFEQYEDVMCLLLIPGLIFWSYIVADDDITIGTTFLTADASNMGSLATFTAAKGGAVVKLFEAIDGWTSNTNQWWPVQYLGAAVDGEA